MGILRFLFALCVIVQHTSPILGFQLLKGSIAVQAFFILSGFYMSLVINEKYIGQKDSYILFVSNRLLRLYPCYWVILILTLLVFLYQGTRGNDAGRLQYFLDNLQSLPLTTSVLIILSNVFMFGLDILNFVSLDSSTKEFFLSSFDDPEKIRGFNFILTRPAWTIGVELMFYLIAPFILKKKKLLLVIGIICLSFIIRFILIHNHLYFQFWNYGFFPSELALFLFGFLSYLLYSKTKESKFKYTGLILLLIIIPCTLYYNSLPYSDQAFHRWVYYLIIIASIPFIFQFTKKNKLDRWIGELSYPMYISHFLVMHLHQFSIFKKFHFGGFAFIGTLFISVLLILLITNPIEKLRQARVKKKEKVHQEEKVTLVAIGA